MEVVQVFNNRKIELNYDFLKTKFGARDTGKIFKILHEHPNYEVEFLDGFDKTHDAFWVKDVTTHYTTESKFETDLDFDVIIGHFVPGIIVKSLEIYGGKLISDYTNEYSLPTYFGGNLVIYKKKLIKDYFGEEERQMLYIVLA